MIELKFWLLVLRWYSISFDFRCILNLFSSLALAWNTTVCHSVFVISPKFSFTFPASNSPLSVSTAYATVWSATCNVPGTYYNPSGNVSKMDKFSARLARSVFLVRIVYSSSSPISVFVFCRFFTVFISTSIFRC